MRAAARAVDGGGAGPCGAATARGRRQGAAVAPAPPQPARGRSSFRPVQAASVALLWGDDGAAVEAAALELRDQTVAPELAQLQYARVALADAHALASSLANLSTVSFGGGGRLVWLADNEPVTRACPKDVKELLVRDLPKVPPSSVLLVTSTARPHPSWVKAFQGHGDPDGFRIQEFPRVAVWEDGDLMAQTERAAEEMGLRLSEEAAVELMEGAQGDTRRLRAELEKLAPLQEAAGPGGEIDADTVRALLVDGPGRQGLKRLTEAVAAGDARAALASLEGLSRAGGMPPLKVLASLVGAVRGWLWVQAAAESREKISDKDLAAALGVRNPKRLHFMRREAAGRSVASMQRALGLLHDAELSMKGGGGGVEGGGVEGGVLGAGSMFAVAGADSERLLRAVVVDLCGALRQEEGERRR